MELPMGQPQQAPQAAPQAPQQAPPQQAPPQPPQQAQPGKKKNTKPFPENEAEARKFSNDILQVMYDDSTHANIVKQMESVTEDHKAHTVSLITSNLIGDRLADVRAQTGRQIEKRLVIGGIQAVIKEISEIAEAQGMFEMSKQDMMESLAESVKVLDTMTMNKPQGQPQQGQPQQGPPQGMPPGMPPQGGM